MEHGTAADEGPQGGGAQGGGQAGGGSILKSAGLGGGHLHTMTGQGGGPTSFLGYILMGGQGPHIGSGGGPAHNGGGGGPYIIGSISHG